MPALRRCSAPRTTATGGSHRATRRRASPGNTAPNTLILETRFECSEGAVTLIDFMPLTRIDIPSVVRLVVGERGRVTMCSRACDPLRLWRDRPLGHAARRRHVARRRRAGHGGAAHAGRSHRPEHEDHRRVHGRGRRDEYRSCSPTRRRICRRRTRSARPAALEATEGFWTNWAAELPAGGTLLGRGPALADHAQGAAPTRRPAASSRRRPPRCRSNWAACATGTIASAGCAMRR